MAKKKQNIIEGGLILTVALIIIKLLGYYNNIQLAIILGETGNGYYLAVYRVFAVIYAVTVTGFPIALSKLVSEFSQQGRYRDVQTTERASNKLFLLVGLIGVAFLAGFAPIYTRLPSFNEPNLVWAIWVFAPGILFCCLMSVQRGYNQGLQNMTPTAVSQVVEVVFKVAVGLLGAYLARGYFMAQYAETGMILGTAMDEESASSLILALQTAGAMLGVSASALFGWLYLVARRWWSGGGILKAQINNSPAPYPTRTIIKQIIWIAIPISLSAAAAQLGGVIDNNMVISILNRLFATAAPTVYASHNGLLEASGEAIADLPWTLYGSYGFADKIVALIPTITGSFGMSALPTVSALWADRNINETKRSVEASVRITMLIAAPAGMGLTFLAGPIAWLIYGSNKPIGAAICVPMLQVMGITAILIALMGIVNALLQGVGRIRVPLILMVIGLVFKIITNYILISIPSVNINGVAYGSLVCYGFIALTGLIILSKSTGIRINLGSTMFKPLVAGLATGIAANLLYKGIDSVLGHASVSTLVAIALAAVVYIIMLGLLRALEREDILSLPGGEKMARILEKVRILR